MASPTDSRVDENEVTSDPKRTPAGDAQDDDAGSGFPLARQSSIYSLTLDEIQNTVCEPGKSFGSMNMDEFLNNIWTVEGADPATAAAAPDGGGLPPLRQGSLTIPAPLCRKTVDEVWAEIHREEQEARHGMGGAASHHGGGGNGGNAQRQPTFGEMTLEDFLIKAGVVREGFGPAATPNPPAVMVPMQQGYGMPAGYPIGAPVGPAAYDPHHHHHHHPVVSDGGQHGKRYGNGYGMSPISPMSSDGVGGGQVDNSGYGGGGGGGGLEVDGAVKMNGRKRVADGAVEKVVERRQRRMIKNRESAARSRARKQAYTVELEAELNMLKEENARLREEERRAQALRKQMIVECMSEHAQANLEKALRSLRRCNSGPW